MLDRHSSEPCVQDDVELGGQIFDRRFRFARQVADREGESRFSQGIGSRRREAASSLWSLYRTISFAAFSQLGYAGP